MTAPATWFGPRHEQQVSPLINLSEISEIELLILKRMREFTIGEHASVFNGAGFDFVGLREWQAGDRFEHIDWAQSTITNFSPLIVRDFEQTSTSSVVIVADASASTRCGPAAGSTIAATIARTIATIGMSAVFFQDSVGLLMFDDEVRHLRGLRPRIGKNQVIHCLDAYQHGHGLQDVRHTLSFSATLAGFMRKTSMVPVVSDFLFEDVEGVLRELARVNAVHDVCIAMIDAEAAFTVPKVSAGWIEAFDVESGRTRVMSRTAVSQMGARIRAYQDAVAAQAKALDLDVIRLASDRTRFEIALMEFVVERRLRRRK